MKTTQKAPIPRWSVRAICWGDHSQHSMVVTRVHNAPQLCSLGHGLA
jgi:hypothetical protein